MLDAVIVIDRSPLLGRGKESIINHPWPEKSQSGVSRSSRSEWDARIARMKAQISGFLHSLRHVPCTNVWQKDKLFFEASFVVFHHDFPSRFPSLLIIYLLENKLFLCRLFGFLLCLLCSRINKRILIRKSMIQLQSFLKPISYSKGLFIELYLFQ